MNFRDQVFIGDALEELKKLPNGIIQCCMTSPPYYGLRDYLTRSWFGGNPTCQHDRNIEHGAHHPNQVEQTKWKNAEAAGKGQTATTSSCSKCGAWYGQIGLEPDPEMYVEHLVTVFREVRRVLRDDGILFLNIGDSYVQTNTHKFKQKDLVGIPWTISKALQVPHYIGKIRNELDRVWLAAIIDGEGSICGSTHKRKDDGTIMTAINITITNTNHALLDNAYRIWRTSRKEHNLHGKGHLGSADTYRWIAHNVDIKADLLKELYPYLIAKKKQALLAWNFLEMSKKAKRLARTAEANSIKEKRIWIVNAISKLNHFKQIDIPAWIQEPPSLFESGWYLRSDIVWSKNNPMPESVIDRPTRSHEYVFLLTKNQNYFYDQEAIREPSVSDHPSGNNFIRSPRLSYTNPDGSPRGNDQQWNNIGGSRNKRSVWTINTQPYKGAHFAVMPEELASICIKAGSSEKGCCSKCGAPWIRVVDRETYRDKAGTREMLKTPLNIIRAGWRNSENSPKSVTIEWAPSCKCSTQDTIPCLILDPFAGSGTTLSVAAQLGRSYLGIELNPEYGKLIEKRLRPSVEYRSQREIFDAMMDLPNEPK